MQKPLFKRPTLVIKNISNYKVNVLDKMLLWPGETKDFFEHINESACDDWVTQITQELIPPTGQLYLYENKGLIDIVDYQQWVFPSDHNMLVAANNPIEGGVLSYDNGQMWWILPSGGDAPLSVSAPLQNNSGTVSIPAASSTQDGFLTKEVFNQIVATSVSQSNTAPIPGSIWFKPGTGTSFWYDDATGRWLSAPAVLAFFGPAAPSGTFMSYHHNVATSFVPYVSQYACILTAVIGRSLGDADISLQFIVNDGTPISVLALDQTEVAINIELAAGDRLAIVCLTDTPYPLVQVTYRLLGV